MLDIDKKGRVIGVPYQAANTIGTELKPELIVLHDTAGRLHKGSSVDWFKSKACKVSAHFVIERDGTITQMVPLNRRASHAGRSSWNGRKLCNSFSVGIEIVNPGKLDADGRAWFHMDSKGRPREPGYDLKETFAMTTDAHGAGRWMRYTDAQIEAVKVLCRAIVEHYPACNDVVTHWMISPGRKVDTNPLFPLEHVRAYALGDVANEVEAEMEDVPADKPVVTPVPLPPITDGPVSVPILVKVSRKAKALSLAKKIGERLAGLLTFAGVADYFGLIKGIFADVQTFISDHALALTITGAIVLAISARWMLGLMVEDVQRGSYVPSGALAPAAA